MMNNLTSSSLIQNAPDRLQGMTTTTVPLKRVAQAEARTRIDHERLLNGFQELYYESVHGTTLDILALNRGGPLRRWRRWWSAPLLYTLEGRRNLFRTAFSIAIGKVVDRMSVGQLAAATGEIAWTCALIADDMIDGAAEREGHRCAHLVYGRVRSWAAVIFSLQRVFLSLLTLPRTPLAARLRMAWLSVYLLSRCLRTQIPKLRQISNMQDFTRDARDVNSSTHWALLAPLMLCADSHTVSAVWDYADAISVNGKMRNDLLDYCGGSTENSTQYEDFHNRRLTFPSIVFLEQGPEQADHSRVRQHFLERQGAEDFGVGEINDLFKKYRTLERCLELMGEKARTARDAVERIKTRPNIPGELPDLLYSWVDHQIDLAEERVEAARNVPC